MSWLKKLFGGSDGGQTAPVAREDYKGFSIEAAPLRAQGQFQIAGSISRAVGGETKTHRFIRADRFATREDAASFTLVKARQLIDQMGDRVFDA